MDCRRSLLPPQKIGGEWRYNWYFISEENLSPHLLHPSSPAERLANSKEVSSQDPALLPVIERMTELHNRKLTCTTITGNFIRHGIAPFQHRPQPLWEIRQKMGILLPWKKWRENMLFLIPGVPHHLPPGVCPLFDGLGDGVALTSMPPCNAYGLPGTQFLDPLPVPKEVGAHGLRSFVAAGPPFGDVSPEEPGPSNGEDEEDTAPGA